MTVTSWMVGLMPERRGWRLGLGIAMVVLGVFALAFLPAASVLSAALLGLAILAAGIFALIGVFRSDGWVEALLMIVLAAMLLFTGGALLVDPVSALVAVTTLIATFLLFSGIARIIIALFNRVGSWGWGIVHGVVNLLLGVLIWAEWPLSGLLAVGFIVGIELILVGLSWIVGARTTRYQKSAPKKSARRSRHR